MTNTFLVIYWFIIFMITGTVIALEINSNAYSNTLSKVKDVAGTLALFAIASFLLFGFIWFFSFIITSEHGNRTPLSTYQKTSIDNLIPFGDGSYVHYNRNIGKYEFQTKDGITNEKILHSEKINNVIIIYHDDIPNGEIPIITTFITENKYYNTWEENFFYKAGSEYEDYDDAVVKIIFIPQNTLKIIEGEVTNAD